MFENLDKLQDLEDRYLDLEAKISDPDVISNQAEWQRYTKAHAKLTEIVTVYREYKKLADTYQEDEAIVKAKEDPELAAMAEEELKELKPEIEVYEEKLTILLLPKDPNDEKNIIMEIRAGAGGDEAALFCRGPVPDVHPLRRKQRLEGGTHGLQPHGPGGLQGSGIHGVRPGRVQPYEV